MSLKILSGPVLLSLAPAVFAAIVYLKVLRILFAIEYETPDLLEDIGVSELKRWYWIRGRIEVRLDRGFRIWIDYCLKVCCFASIEDNFWPDLSSIFNSGIQ